jgi:hypothetical protein
MSNNSINLSDQEDSKAIDSKVKDSKGDNSSQVSNNISKIFSGLKAQTKKLGIFSSKSSILYDVNDFLIKLQEKVFQNEPKYDLIQNCDEKKLKERMDKILAKIDQLLKIKNIALNKNMLIKCPNNQKNYINIQKNDNNLKRKSPDLKKINNEKKKKNCNNFKKIVQSVRIFEKKDDEEINPLNSNETKKTQNLNLINPPLAITKNKRKMTFNQKRYTKKIKRENYIFKNIGRNIKNVKNEINSEEKKRANSCIWKTNIRKVVYVIKCFS